MSIVKALSRPSLRPCVNEIAAHRGRRLFPGQLAADWYGFATLTWGIIVAVSRVRDNPAPQQEGGPSA